MIEVPIERIRAPSADVFRRRYMARPSPVILTGGIDDWPARSKWSPEYFRATYGDRKLWVIPTRDGKATFSAKAGVPYQSIRFADYIDGLVEAPPRFYMVFRVEEQLPELLGDIRLPVYCRAARWHRSRFWFAPPDVGGVLHRDLPQNLYAQVSGRKKWTLFDRRQSWRMYSHPLHSGVPNYSRADPEKPDYERFPRLRGARMHSAILEPGELLYIPSLWWHQARSIDTSISINLWWAEGPLLGLVWAAQAFMNLRRLKL
jgi:hypothetical protein